MFPRRSLIFSLGMLPALAFAGNDSVTLEGAWVRALPPNQPNTAAYLTVRNSGPEAATVTAVSADLASRVEIHTTREVDDYVRMEQLSTLTVAAGDKQVLAPGGTHLMLLDLERMPKAGESVELCLTLASGEQVCTEAPVRKSADSGDHHHH